MLTLLVVQMGLSPKIFQLYAKLAPFKIALNAKLIFVLNVLKTFILLMIIASFVRVILKIVWNVTVKFVLNVKFVSY